MSIEFHKSMRSLTYDHIFQYTQLDKQAFVLWIRKRLEILENKTPQFIRPGVFLRAGHVGLIVERKKPLFPHCRFLWSKGGGETAARAHQIDKIMVIGKVCDYFVQNLELSA